MSTMTDIRSEKKARKRRSGAVEESCAPCCAPAHLRNPLCPALRRSAHGYSLIELLITLAIFALVTAMISSVYSAFIKNAAREKSTAKAELDVSNIFWPLVKEVQSAGFGAALTGTCSPGLTIAGSDLVIHSTATGDDSLAGTWSYIGTLCAVSLPEGERVVIMNTAQKSLMGSEEVDTGGYLTNCVEDYTTNIAYWSPFVNSGDLDCYETRYALTAYGADRPARCAPGANVQKLSRSVSRTVSTNYQPIMDCVLELDYRFGCINSSTGALSWHTGTTCPTGAKLRLARIGMVVQSSTRTDTQVPSVISLFEDLGGTLQKDITLTADQRYYTWKKREQTIPLRNLE